MALTASSIRDTLRGYPKLQELIHEKARIRKSGLCGRKDFMLSLIATRYLDMADLIVRNLDPSLVQALKKRAARHGRSAEAEHRAILEAVLFPARRRSLAQVLSSMPNVGKDEDFTRHQDRSYHPNVFD